MQEAREAYWRSLFKRYLFIVIETESTIYDDQIGRSALMSEADLTAIRQLADEAEDDYST